MYDHQKLILKNKLLLRQKVIRSCCFLTLHLALYLLVNVQRKPFRYLQIAFFFLILHPLLNKSTEQ
jgi:hypothetical protein